MSDKSLFRLKVIQAIWGQKRVSATDEEILAACVDGGRYPVLKADCEAISRKLESALTEIQERDAADDVPVNSETPIGETTRQLLNSVVNAAIVAYPKGTAHHTGKGWRLKDGDKSFHIEPILLLAANEGAGFSFVVQVQFGPGVKTKRILSAQPTDALFTAVQEKIAELYEAVGT